MTAHRRLKTHSNLNTTQNSTYSQSHDTNQNSAYSRAANDRYELTQDHHKQKKKINRFPYICFILSTLIILTIIAVLLCVLLINSNQKKKIIPNKEIALRWNSIGITIAGVSNISGTDNMHLNGPADLALDYQGTMFIADRYNHRIQRYVRGSMSGTTVAGFGNGTSSTSANGLIQPIHVIVDDEENLHITDHGNHRVLSWSRNALSGVVVAGFGKKNR